MMPYINLSLMDKEKVVEFENTEIDYWDMYSEN